MHAPPFILRATTPSDLYSPPSRPPLQVLPRYFKHNKLGSFYQQLHTYGFRRSGTAPDSAVEFHHDQYTGTADEFADWIRQGGAVSKRTVPVRTASQDIPLNVGPHANPFPGLGGGHHGPPNSSAPPPQLLHDMLQVHEGMRQLAHRFQQQKATHAVQLRTILQKLTMRGLLAPESAAYISSLPPQTPMGNGPVGNVPGVGGMPGQNLPGMQNMDLSALAYSGALQGNLGGGNPSNALQAQLDALEAGLLANPLGPGGPMQSDVGAVNVGGSSSLDGVQNVGGMGENRQQTSTRLSSIDSTAAAFLQEDFADPVAFGVHVDNRQPQPYPVGASSSTHGGSHSGASSSKDVTNDLVKLGSDSPPSGQPSEAGGSNTVLTRDSPQGISPPPVTTTAADAAEKVDANSSSAVEAT